MLVGVDFDNTIVCYDAVFRRLAIQRGLVPPGGNLSKRALHDLLHASDQAELWTEIQGEVYGPLMCEATPFPGVMDFFRRCHRAGIAVRIISHRTRHPYRGRQYDLHEAARQWLMANGFHDAAGIGLSASDVFFEESRRAKLARIVSEGCTHFVEDLVEVIAEPEFPRNVRAILFDPNAMHAGLSAAEKGAVKKGIRTFISRADSWGEVVRLLNVPESEKR